MSDEEAASVPADPREQLQEKILSDYPRLGPDDTFKMVEPELEDVYFTTINRYSQPVAA